MFGYSYQPSHIVLVDETDDEAIESVAVAAVEKNLANALDLSDSEDEEKMEDLIEDFALEIQDMEEDVSSIHLYTGCMLRSRLSVGFSHSPGKALLLPISSSVSYLFSTRL